MQNYEKKVTFQSKTTRGSVTIFSPFFGGKTATNALNIGILISYPPEKTVTMLKRFNTKCLHETFFHPNFAYGKPQTSAVMKKGKGITKSEHISRIKSTNKEL